MSGLDWSIIVGGCGLGLVHLGAGIAIGLRIRRGSSRAKDSGHREVVQPKVVAARLRELTQDMSSAFGKHNTQIDRAVDKLSHAEVCDNQDWAELVLDVVGNVICANRTLQMRLTTAESLLQEQATEIETHVSRSMTDPLTGLPNRRGFDEQLLARIVAQRKAGEPFSILLLDVDFFKQLNDEYGHPAGDRMLQTVGRALRVALRREDTIARYGGEEFAVLLPNTTIENAVRVAHKLRASTARASLVEAGVRLSVTVSGGLAMMLSSEEGLSLVERADTALYAAKAAGRNCIFMHDGSDCQQIPEPSGELLTEAGHGAEPNHDTVWKDLSDALNEAAQQEIAQLLETEMLSSAVSIELTQICDELRRCMTHLGGRKPEAFEPARSQIECQD